MPPASSVAGRLQQSQEASEGRGSKVDWLGGLKQRRVSCGRRHCGLPQRSGSFVAKESGICFWIVSCRSPLHAAGRVVPNLRRILRRYSMMSSMCGPGPSSPSPITTLTVSSFISRQGGSLSGGLLYCRRPFSFVALAVGSSRIVVVLMKREEHL
jgi:hypothetical protein